MAKFSRRTLCISAALPCASRSPRWPLPPEPPHANKYVVHPRHSPIKSTPGGELARPAVGCDETSGQNPICQILHGITELTLLASAAVRVKVVATPPCGCPRAASATRTSLPHIESSMSLSRSSGSPVSLCIRRTVLFELAATFRVPNDSCGWSIRARTALRRFFQLWWCSVLITRRASSGLPEPSFCAAVRRRDFDVDLLVMCPARSSRLIRPTSSACGASMDLRSRSAESNARSASSAENPF